jgi:putative ABC transport system substrate-binding protein
MRLRGARMKNPPVSYDRRSVAQAGIIGAQIGRGLVNNRRKLLVALGAGGLAAPLISFAQQKGKVWRIGFLGAASASGISRRMDAFRAGLRDLGYVEGKNLVIEYRWAEEKYDRLPELAAELVRLKVEVIVTPGNPGIIAAKNATTTIPIVMAVSGDPVATGFVASLARPGGNITGMAGFGPEGSAKRLELLKDAFPRTRQVAVLLNPDNPGNIRLAFPAMEATAKSLKLELQPFGVRGPVEIDSAFAAMAKRRVDAVVSTDDGLFIANAGAIANLAAKLRLPSVGTSEFAEAGGLMAYGANRVEMFRRAAYFVDRIFKGAKPADLPVEQATRFETVLNQKTAKALGLQFPQAVLARADRVIE